MSIFGGNTGVTYGQLRNKRKVAEALMRSMAGKTPKNVGEGISAIGDALLARTMLKKADSEQAAFDERFAQVAPPNTQGLLDLASSPYATDAHRGVIDALMKGAPNYRRGGLHRGGIAVVGEDGPEVVDLPSGSRIEPAKRLFRPGNEYDDAPEWFRNMPPDRQREFLDMTPEEKQRVVPDLERGVDPNEVLPPIDGREMLQPEGNLQGGAGNVVVAGGESGDRISDFAPAGVGGQNDVNKSVYAYRTFMQALDDYDRLIKDGGVALLPGPQKDSIKVARRNLQMQMKELYNLGVLNGPDLDLMNEILLDPVGIGNKVLDVTGVADTEERVANNVRQVRQIIRQLVEPQLSSMGVAVDDVTPEKRAPSDLSDEELLQLLQGGS